MTNQTPQEIIAAASRLPIVEQAAIADALLENAMREEHGEELDEAIVCSAWHVEVNRRLEEVRGGIVNTVPADQAERMIRSGEHPSI